MSNVKVEILVGGKPVKQHWFENKFWVEAKQGRNYEIKVKNSGSRRVLAVVSVDGLDVLSGRPADKDSGGYIIDGYSSYSIQGFRVSNDEVNLFEFSKKEQSYAAKSPTGEQSTENCGVIAVRVIEEKAKPLPSLEEIWRRSEPYIPPYIPPHRPWRPRTPYPYDVTWDAGDVRCKSLGGDKSASPRATLRASASLNMLSLADTSDMTASYERERGLDMGTKFSEEKAVSKVKEVSFEQGEILDQIEIYYASAQGLLDLGVTVKPEPKVVLPKPFKDSRYCQPPK